MNVGIGSEFEFELDTVEIAGQPAITIGHTLKEDNQVHYATTALSSLNAHNPQTAVNIIRARLQRERNNSYKPSGRGTKAGVAPSLLKIVGMGKHGVLELPTFRRKLNKLRKLAAAI